MNYGVDRYRRPQKLSMVEEENRRKEREAYLQQQVNDLWRSLPTRQASRREKTRRFPRGPQENCWYFIEKNAPLLNPGSARSCASCARSRSTSITAPEQ